MGATNAEEIERQHQEAVRQCKEGLDYAPAVNHGEIPLTFKTRPVADAWKEFLYQRSNGSSGEDEKKDPSVDDQDSETMKKLSKEFNASFFPAWSSRGRVDITALQELVREGYTSMESPQTAGGNDDAQSVASTATNNTTLRDRPAYTEADVKSKTNLWCPANAAVNNVFVCRPSHDAWGIGKIVLIFCDDFLRDVFEMPWWHSNPELRRAIQPIIDVLQVPEHRIVRMLLASLPPGVTIPVHSDSGEWVQHTHRVHCPVIVKEPSNVAFYCGHTEHSLNNIPCEPGHVFEINNQSKHAVSNCSNDHRVHLILDYVDEGFIEKYSKPRVKLNPGEIVLQTRRSIDRLANKGKRHTPSFFILGAQKAGTTSLYEYMIQHPLVIPARRRETHCLDWRWNEKLTTVKKQQEWCHKFYFTTELEYHPSCMTGDSTPSYLLDSKRVIPRMKAVFDWPLLFFVMLRDPVKRAESHFAMVTSTDGTPEQLKVRGNEWRQKTFQQIVREELESMKLCGLIPYWNLNGKEGEEFDKSVFDSFAGSTKEEEAWDLFLSKHVLLNTGSYGLLSRGLYELNLRPWLKAFDPSRFWVIKLEDMKKDGVQETMRQVWKHLDVPSSVEVEDDAPKNTREYQSKMDESTRKYLQRFFEPQNERFEQMMRQQMKHCNPDKWVGESWKYN